MAVPEPTPAPDSDRALPDDSGPTSDDGRLGSIDESVLVADLRPFLRAVRSPSDREPTHDAVRAVSRIRYHEYDWSLALDPFHDGGRDR